MSVAYVCMSCEMHFLKENEEKKQDLKTQKRIINHHQLSVSGLPEEKSTKKGCKEISVVHLLNLFFEKRVCMHVCFQ